MGWTIKMHLDFRFGSQHNLLWPFHYWFCFKKEANKIFLKY